MQTEEETLLSILNGSFLDHCNAVTANTQATGGGMFPCFQPKVVNTSQATSFDIPQAAIVEIGKHLGAQDRANLMFLNRLFLEAFKPSNVQNTKQEYLTNMLKESWKKAIRKSQRFFVYFEFEDGKGDTKVCVQMQKGFAIFFIPETEAFRLKNFTEKAFDTFRQSDYLVTDGFVQIGIPFDNKTLQTANGGGYKKANVVDLISQSTTGLKLKRPNVTSTGFLSKLLQPISQRKLAKIYDKISIYTLDLKPIAATASPQTKQNSTNSTNESKTFAPLWHIKQGPKGILSSTDAILSLANGTIDDKIKSLRQNVNSSLKSAAEAQAKDIHNAEGGSRAKVRNHVVRVGSRGGKYIVVKGKKVYV